MPAGRPSKYDPEQVAKVCEIMEEDGLYVKDACAMLDISHETWANWKREKPEFLAAIKKSENIYKKKLLKVVHDAADSGVWQAAMEMLKRRFPDQYSERREVTGPKGDPVEINFKDAE